MTGARTVLLFCIAIIALSSGCAGPSTNVHNQSAPPSTSVSIAFQPSPPTSVSIGGNTSITAVVNNDTTNAGVDWALLCPSGSDCGKLSALHSPSGTAVTYTSPSVIPGNSQTFTIQGFATADHTQNVTASISVTGFASVLKGTYVFATKGEDVNGAFQLAGVVVLDGNGGVTSGEQTHSDYLLSVSDPISGGSYFIGPDGRGTLTINTADQNIGQGGIENLALVVLDNTRALIQTFDDPNLPLLSGEASSGTLELQTSTAAPVAGYAFVVDGTDITTVAMALGGVLNIDSPNSISGNGSVIDEQSASTGLNPAGPVSGTLTSPDALGSLKFNLVTGFAPAIQFTGYIVDSTHIKLIESDNGTGTGFGSTAGVAIAQGAATGTFTNNSAFAGTYVFKISGQDASLVPSSLASLGQFTADASNRLTNGYNDEVLAGISVLYGTTYAVSDSFTGTYSFDSSGTGRVDSTITYTTNNVAGPELIFYLTGNGNPPLVLDADSTSLGNNSFSAGTGITYTQAPPPFSFNGPFGLSFVQSSGSFPPPENDATGQVTVNGNSNNLTGVIDFSLSTTPSPNLPVSGSFVAPAIGRFTGTLNNAFFTAPNTIISVAYYPVDANNILFIETDFSVSAESTLGQFIARTPVCSLTACH